jgi:hypothetical protein
MMKPPSLKEMREVWNNLTNYHMRILHDHGDVTLPFYRFPWISEIDAPESEPAVNTIKFYTRKTKGWLHNERATKTEIFGNDQLIHVEWDQGWR